MFLYSGVETQSLNPAVLPGFLSSQAEYGFHQGAKLFLWGTEKHIIYFTSYILNYLKVSYNIYMYIHTYKAHRRMGWWLSTPVCFLNILDLPFKEKCRSISIIWAQEAFVASPRLRKAADARGRWESDWNDEAVTAAARANRQSKEDLKSCSTLPGLCVFLCDNI